MDEVTKKRIKNLQEGDRRALSRVLSLVEEQDDQAFEILEHLFEHTGKGMSVGITGPAGAGKSTLIDQLIRLVRKQDQKISVLAVDPSSPFSGGAVLGDRVRMQGHCSDDGVFIRSVGSRGKSGGVSFATRALLQILDVYGSEYTVVETVGAGQSEVDIMNLVDTTVVVLTPESGDSIQALKAGMLEIADVFVINKKDREGANRVAHDIEMMLSLVPSESQWKPPIILTSAQSGEGVAQLLEALQNHRGYLNTLQVDPARLRRKRKAFLYEMIQTRLAGYVEEWIDRDPHRRKALESTDEPNLYKMVKEGIAACLKS
ncbi:MAG: methylmalonyl Co-A mutase-associated GTPase MeaB [Deltaproteobacteria bacterium]|nr:methylmalonyl Co-A mutase-associated GTPase MeaB [Deltaproteobacteria bacterium]